MKKKTDNNPLIQFQLFIFYKPACLQKNFHGRLLSVYYPSGFFPRTGTMGTLRMSTTRHVINLNQ